MPQLTELQTWFLVIALVFALVILIWSLIVVDPNRDSTIRFLKDRNTTLEYWINKINMDNSMIENQVLSGDRLTRKRRELQAIKKLLIRQLERCEADILFYNTVMENQPIPDELA